MVNSLDRLRWVLLVSVGSVAYASLYVIRQWQEFHNVYPGFRPGGATGDSNYFALATVLALPISFCLLWDRGHKWERLFALGCLGISLLALTFAASRGGFLGMTAELLFLVSKTKRRLRNLAVMAVMVIPISIAFPSSPISRLLHPGYADNLASNARSTVWKCGLQMVQEHPLFGIGIGNFKLQVESYQMIPGMDARIRTLAHNTYIEIAAEMGIPALLIFLGILASSFVEAERVRRQALRVQLRTVHQAAVSVQAALIGLAVSIFFLTAHYQKLLWFTVFLSICLRPLLQKSVIAKRRRQERVFHPDGASSPALVGIHG
jgi:O-antigen ligase